MKLILSRKGFDASHGGVPSPIFPDGSLCPLPIPSVGPPRLRDVSWRDRPLSNVVSAITNGRISPDKGVHLDPDLQKIARPRMPGWRPVFGQVSAAQSHLSNRGVGRGDLFLFFGWFRRVILANGRWRFDCTAPDLHVIFGWLQIEETMQPIVDADSIPAWTSEHPHVRSAPRMAKNNTLYFGCRWLELPGVAGRISGCGVFDTHVPILTLTAEAQNRSDWQLPPWFSPTPGRPPLSFHADPRRWESEKTYCRLKTVGRGQEFVLDCDYYPEAFGWLQHLFSNAAG